MRANAIYRQHQEREDNTLSQFRNVEYILQAGEQGLDHLCLAASGLNFFHGTLAEFMGAHRTI